MYQPYVSQITVGETTTIDDLVLVELWEPHLGNFPPAGLETRALVAKFFLSSMDKRKEITTPTPVRCLGVVAIHM